MKFIIISLFLLSSSVSFALDNPKKNTRYIQEKWFISPIVLKEDFFTYRVSVLIGKAEVALAVEPFIYLQSYAATGTLVSSPIKQIHRKKNLFYIYTLSGTVYVAHEKDLLSINSFDDYYLLLKRRFNIYRRRDLWELQNEIERKEILEGQKYKSWTYYVKEEDNDKIFNWTKTLKRMKNDKKILISLTEDELDTLGFFQ